MTVKTSLFFLLSVILFIHHAPGQHSVIFPTPETVLSELHISHPRLMMNDSDLDRLKMLDKDNAIVRKYIQDIMEKADKYCRKPTVNIL